MAKLIIFIAPSKLFSNKTALIQSGAKSFSIKSLHHLIYLL